MPTDIELDNVPSQNFQLLLEQDSYDLTLKNIGDITYVSITRNSEVLLTNIKAMPNQNIIQNAYQFNEHGNFVFSSTNVSPSTLVASDDYPFYENFGISTLFQYITKAEVESGL